MERKIWSEYLISFGEGNYLFQLVRLVTCAKRKTTSIELLLLPLMTLHSFDQYCFGVVHFY